jgi:hypothetical protein
MNKSLVVAGVFIAGFLAFKWYTNNPACGLLQKKCMSTIMHHGLPADLVKDSCDKIRDKCLVKCAEQPAQCEKMYAKLKEDIQAETQAVAK